MFLARESLPDRGGNEVGHLCGEIAPVSDAGRGQVARSAVEKGAHDGGIQHAPALGDE
jgi:hypothetical protein